MEVEVERPSRLPLWIVAVMLALVAVATGNLTGIGIGSGPLLYDTVALPRLVIAVVLTLAAWTAWFATAARRGEPLRWDVTWALLGGLALWTTISLAFSPHRALGVLGQSERLEGFVTIVLYALLYGLALQVVRRIGDARLLVTAIGAAAIALSVYGLAQFAGIEPFDYSIEGYTFEVRRAFATFGNPTFLAGLLVLVLPPLGALAIRARTQASRMGWALGAVVVAATLFVTFSRGAWLAAALQVVLGVIILWRLRESVPWRELRIPIVVGAVGFALLIGLSAGATGELNVAQRITGAIERTGSVSERAFLAEGAVSAALARPLTGYGPDAFLSAFRLHRPDDYVIAFAAYAMSNNAHSWPLHTAATLGIPGALLLVAAILLALVKGVPGAVFSGRSRSRSPLRPAARTGAPADLLMASLWVGCGGFVVHMLSGVAVLGSTVPFWILLGAMGAPLARTASLPRGVTTAGVALGAATTLLALSASTALIVADASYLASRIAFRGMAPGDPLELAQRARDLNPTSVKYARGVADAATARAIAAMGSGASAEEVWRLHTAAVDEFETLFELDSNDYPGFAWLAALQARTGRYLDDPAQLRQAQATAQRAARLDLQSERVLALSMGDFSDGAIAAAEAVQPLP